MYSPHWNSILVFSPPIIRFGSVIVAVDGVLSSRSYTRMLNRFSSVSTTSFRIGSTATAL